MTINHQCLYINSVILQENHLSNTCDLYWYSFYIFIPPDSVWAVYILPEEVGTRIHALGVHIIALRSKSTKGSNPHPGQLDIISPTDPTSPVVTWERDKMRRTGCLGNMVFIEIGRRCRGGAGLVWMYASSVDSAGLRETLHRLACHNILWERGGMSISHLSTAFLAVWACVNSWSTVSLACSWMGVS